MAEGTGWGELSRLADLLQQTAFRKSFASNPNGALDDEGISGGGIPEEVLDTLIDLSYEELRALFRVRRVLESADAPEDIRLQMV